LNEFSFAVDDPDGQRCPLGAHIRRANPRDMLGGETQRHRIVRRGRLYGPKLDQASDDGQSRGLYFVALNANIRRQFEFIQQTWLNGRKFGGLFDERDPLLGKDERGEVGEVSQRAFSVQGQFVRRRLVGLPRFVRVRGGEYFFLPGLRALNYLAEP
jgi:deferrochelatase/peroxidase EfeB